MTARTAPTTTWSLRPARLAGSASAAQTAALSQGDRIKTLILLILARTVGTHIEMMLVVKVASDLSLRIWHLTHRKLSQSNFTMRTKPGRRITVNESPRLMTRSEAAGYCGLSPEGFSSWISSGKLPPPLPGTRRWDRRALDLSLDRLSGMTQSDASPVSALDERRARHARPAPPQFRGSLVDGSLAKSPDKTLKRIAQTWNGVVKRRNLPFNRLAVPRALRYLAIPLSEFPASFQADVQAYVVRLTQIDIFAEEGPKKALRPTSLRNVRASIRQFASAQVARGRTIEDIISLGSLLELEAYKEGLRFFLDRNGGQPTTWLWGLAGALMSIARYHVKLPEAEIKTLATIRGRLKLDTDRVTEKNRRRLAQYDDLYNVELLLLLPSRLAQGAHKSKPGTSRTALDVMHAVAIEILLACPMRMNNLAALDIDRHLNWRGAGNSQTVSIYVPAAETKNGVAIEADFHRDTTALIRLYLNLYSPILHAINAAVIWAIGRSILVKPGFEKFKAWDERLAQVW